ncbi:type IV toxin-antitoxin system AbiEi family antitoxin domain-containing protein [Mycobacterium sp. RTGN5]|uniref:type IV toxin-antitoxin system AbiEi family antitoxin domain-containing protein n=1 Tax=Mycobacterium sp. RTGN5 TaxID=3016522 RepID=UPI0029C9AD1D|nr:type IV toxin-antitoxin system AbiEi family antitoxin domain-containing protein [Mycobacterium sp. RTGN5]
MLDDLLRRHDGVITLAQANDAGLTEQAVRRRARAGHWRRCSAGVYFVADREFTHSARVRAAVWSYGHSACASGLAAAWWLELTRFAPDVVEVTVPRDSHGRCHDGSRVRRRNLSDLDIVERRGLRVTALPLTAIEAAVRRGGGPKLMDEALQRHTELRHLWAAHLRNTGRYGSPGARRLLQAADDGTKSQAERLFTRLLATSGISGWKANQQVIGYEVDVLFRAAKVVVEVDGFAFHTDPEAFERDRRKQNALVLAGYQVLRFTWLDLTEYPERVLALVQRAISAR